MLYVYGIVGADSPPPGESGIRDGTVRIVKEGRVAALVSQVDESVELDAADAEGHLDVLIAAVKRGPVLPVRLGTLMADADAVRHQALSTQSEELVARLDALDGVVELNLDADDDETASLAELLPAGGRETRGVSFEERIELGRQVADRLVEHRIGLAETVLTKLRGHAVDDAPRSEIAGPEDPVLRWAFLVRRDELGDFDEAVARLRADLPQLHFTYVGPLPVTHFDPRSATTQGASADSFGGNGAWGW